MMSLTKVQGASWQEVWSTRIKFIVYHSLCDFWCVPQLMSHWWVWDNVSIGRPITYSIMIQVTAQLRALIQVLEMRLQVCNHTTCPLSLPPLPHFIFPLLSSFLISGRLFSHSPPLFPPNSVLPPPPHPPHPHPTPATKQHRKQIVAPHQQSESGWSWSCHLLSHAAAIWAPLI
jgi:hypothetical protein